MARRRIAAFSWLVLALLVAGCRDARGPTTTLQGVVRVRGAAVGPGWLEFLPIDGTLGDLRSARLQSDGSFRVERVPVGRTAIRLVGTPRLATGDPALDLWLGQLRQVHLVQKSIAPSPTPPLLLDLEVEEQRSRDAAPRNP